MVNIIVKYLSSKIFNVLDHHHSQNFADCDTLKELKGKFIIKTDAKIQEILKFNRHGL